MPRQRFDSLTFPNTPPKPAGQAAMRVIQAVEGLPANLQVAGVSLAFVLILKKWGLRAGNALEVVNNMLDRTLAKVPTLGAIKDYVREEV